MYGEKIKDLKKINTRICATSEEIIIAYIVPERLPKVENHFISDKSFLLPWPDTSFGDWDLKTI